MHTHTLPVKMENNILTVQNVISKQWYFDDIASKMPYFSR